MPTSARERGVLLSAADGQLQARPFDAAARRLVGDPRTLPVAAGANTPYHSAMLSASADLLATVAMPMPYGVRLGTVARDGTVVTNVQAPATELAAPLSGRDADGAADRRSGGTGQSRHLGRGPSRRQLRPRHHGHRFRPPPGVVSGWATVGLRIRHPERAPVEHCGGRWHRRAPGTAVSGHLLRADRLVDATGAFSSSTRARWVAGDVWSVSLEAGGAARAILSGPFPEYDARLSPDGQWLVYVSEETGRPVVSVRAMSGPPNRLVVSSDGGSQPVWRRDGREILYVDLGGRLRGRSVQQRQPGGELTLGVGDHAERTAHRLGTLGHAVRRLARRSAAVLHRPDARAEAERDRCGDRLAGAPQVAAPHVNAGWRCRSWCAQGHGWS